MHKSSFDFETLRDKYLQGLITPVDTVKEVYRRIGERGQDFVWTCLVPESEALARAEQLADINPASLPLYGLPFCVKDNIHVQGLQTTASCAAFAHFPEQTAPVVSKLLDCGAILIGKNTMDQFATGLVGIRSEGHPVNPFNHEYIPGGSSSGSAVAVSTHLVSFALGSDTGGSGRVPAALNNIVGLKPTPGIMNTTGMVYANRSFDCMPIFALTCPDAEKVFSCALDADHNDPFMMRDLEHGKHHSFPQEGLKIGIPDKENTPFFGDDEAETSFNKAVETIKNMGAAVQEIDFSPFVEIGTMLFDGPILAERMASVGSFLESHKEDVNPVVRGIIDKAKTYTAVDLYNELHRLQHLKALAFEQLEKVDALMVPTTGTIYKIAEVEKDPVTLNKNMGHYTYFANLIGLSALAVPASIRKDKLPFGVCFIAGQKKDHSLLTLGSRWQKKTNLPFGFHGGNSHVSA